MNLEKGSRKYEILYTAVDQYVKDAQPITSQILHQFFETVSTATLRNELSSLEAMGYLRQIHTSGGRIPTSAGYKVYVDNILNGDMLSDKVIKDVQEDYDKKSINLLSTLSSFAKGLSKLTNCPTVLMQNGLDELKIKNIQIIPLLRKNALLLIETDCGIIDDSIDISSDTDRNSCNEASQYLSDRFKGNTIRYMIENINSICLSTSSTILAFRELLTHVADSLIAVTKKGVNITKEGLPILMQSLTTDETNNLTNMYDLLEDEKKVLQIIEDNVDKNNISCEIGNNIKGGMIMTAPIIIGGVNVASLSLVAPQRIDYANLASSLKYITEKAKELEETKGDDNE